MAGGTVSGPTSTNSPGYAVGMAVGSAGTHSEVHRCYANVNVNATPPGSGYDGNDEAAGGIAGLVQGAVITDIYAVGNVKGRNSPGGLVGRVINGDPSTMASILHKGVYIGDANTTRWRTFPIRESRFCNSRRPRPFWNFSPRASRSGCFAWENGFFRYQSLW